MDAGEAFVDVLLDLLRVTLLAKDLQQVVVGQEVETREALALRLQVLVQALLDLLQLVVHVRQRGHHAVRGASPHRVGVRVHHLRVGAVGAVDLVEQRRLARQLAPDILRRHEDGLEVHPLPLHTQLELNDL